MKRIVSVLILTLLILISCNIVQENDTLIGYIFKLSEEDKIYDSCYLLSDLLDADSITAEELLSRPDNGYRQYDVLSGGKYNLDEFLNQEVYIVTKRIDYPDKINPLYYRVESIKPVVDGRND